MSHHPVQRENGHGARIPSFIIVYHDIELTEELQLDAGQHPAYDGLAALPFFDDFDLSTVDVLLISQ